MNSIEHEVEQGGRFRRIVGLVETGVATLGNRAAPHEDEFEPHRRMQMERFIGKLVFMGGDHYDEHFIKIAAKSGASNLKNEGFLDPSITLGIHAIWLSKDASDPRNQRLSQMEAALTEEVRDSYGKITHTVGGQVYVRPGGGSETKRAYNAVLDTVENFETELGYGVDETPLEGKIGLVAVVNTRWASRVFNGVRYDDLVQRGGLVKLREVGPTPKYTRWVTPSSSRLAIPVYD
jgi:hypothetical protein